MIRFFRRLRIAPGFRLNFSKSGVSLSAGRPGAWVTAGRNGTTTSIGLPGTGLFWRSRSPATPGLSGNMLPYLLALLLAAIALLASGCATVHFDEEPDPVPFQAEVTVTSRVADIEFVRGYCLLKAREYGAPATPNRDAPACSWQEPGGRIVVLWANAKSFNNHLGMESAGHELFHWHHVVEHR